MSPTHHNARKDRSPRARAARGPRSPLVTVAAMFAFSPDRLDVHLQTSLSNDGARRFVRTGVSKPSSQPGSHPAAPNLPATAPTEPVHERAFPQADGEP
jgi:hypothetical protein